MVKPGDVIGFCGREAVSRFINVVTLGLPAGPMCGLSHVGIVANYDSEPLLFECTTLTDIPCVVTGKRTKGTQAVGLSQRLASYDGQAFVYPLYRPLYQAESRRLTDFLVDRLGRPYNAKEAIESGGWFGALAAVASLCRVPNGRSYFCSKEVADALAYIGLWSTDDPAKWSPNSLVRRLRRSEILLRRRRLK